MSDEAVAPVADLPAEIAAPDADVTATPAEAPVSGEDTPVETKESKTFAQEDVDKIVAKRLERERRKWEREHQPAPEAAASPKADGEPVKPDIKTFQTVEEYDAAMEKYSDDKHAFKAAQQAQKAAKEQRESEYRKVIGAHEDREDAARERYDDYEQVVRNPKLRITNPMADAMFHADNGPDIAYHLGKNPKEAERIAELSPVAQVKEIGKLEAKLLAEPPAKKASAAPPPISPVSARGGNTAVDTTDPKSLEKLGTSAWIEADRARQRREWEQAHR